MDPTRTKLTKNTIMKTSRRLILYILMTAGLLSSCSKQDNNDDNLTSTTTYKDLDALFERMGERQKLYVDIAPVELPNYIYNFHIFSTEQY